MAYDEKLAKRLRKHFSHYEDVEEKKMFGGLCYLVAKHMCCGIVGDTLMARVGADNYINCLTKKHVREMDFTGKVMKCMIYIEPAGLRTDKELKSWVTICVEYVKSLPTKK